MKTKKLFIIFSVVLVLWGIIITGTTVTAAEKTYNLRQWVHTPPTVWQSEPHKRFIADIEKSTQGRIIIKPYWAESLAPAKDAINALKSGLFDFGQFQPFMNPGEFPVSEISNLPFLTESPSGIIEGYRKLYKEGLMPEYQGKGFQLLDFHPTGLLYLMFRDKQIDTLAKFKGLKIRSQTSITVDMLKAFGATPVSMAGTDLYMALDRGVIDGTLSSPGFMAPCKLFEVGKYFLDQPLYGGNLFVAMNQKTWDSLPADLQSIFKECVRRYTDDWTETSEIMESVNSKKLLKEKGVIFYPLQPGELEKMKQATAPIEDKFIKNMDSMGLQGLKCVEIFKSAQPK